MIYVNPEFQEQFDNTVKCSYNLNQQYELLSYLYRLGHCIYGTNNVCFLCPDFANKHSYGYSIYSLKDCEIIEDILYPKKGSEPKIVGLLYYDHRDNKWSIHS